MGAWSKLLDRSAKGRLLGIDRFLLTQWLAPLSSEAAKLIVAMIFALRLRAPERLRPLLSAIRHGLGTRRDRGHAHVPVRRAILGP